MGKDHTLFALIDGTVAFVTKANRNYITVKPLEETEGWKLNPTNKRRNLRHWRINILQESIINDVLLFVFMLIRLHN